MQVHDKLRVLRVCRSWSQEQMAERLGWAPNTYAKIERGETDIKLEKLQQIADVLGIELSELLRINDGPVFNFAENVTQGNLAHTILLSESQCAHELDKARLVIAHKDQEIAWLREQVAQLQQVIDLLKPVASVARADAGGDVCAGATRQE